jgi:hypothetical protein
MPSAPNRRTLASQSPGIRIVAIVALLILVWQWPRIESWFIPQDHARPPVASGPPVKAQPDDVSANTGMIGRREDSQTAPSTPDGWPSVPDGSSPATTGEPGDTQTLKPRLTEIRRNVFQSSAGLIYLPGSADGHRLDHVLRHAKDDPGKPIHGVFDGDREVVLAAIDEAFESAQQSGPHVRRRNERDRQVITVNMKRRVGFAGGESGTRNGHPECRFIRLVLENDNEVVTAYPVAGF